MVKISFAVNYTHFAFVVLEDLEQISHNVREECDTSEHHCQGSYHLNIADREVVSIANGWQNREGKVHTGHKLYVQQRIMVVFLPEIESGVPSAIVTLKIHIILKLLIGELSNRYSKPEAA